MKIQVASVAYGKAGSRCRIRKGEWRVRKGEWRLKTHLWRVSSSKRHVAGIEFEKASDKCCFRKN